MTRALAIALVAACGGGARGGTGFPATEAELMAHVRALASAELRGREAGTDDERRAADYVAGEMRRLGLAVELVPFRYRHAGGEERESRNVLGWLEGRERGRWILVGAHYDHLGVDASGAIYRGADDDASGIAGLLGVAQAFARAAERPRHSILFVAFGAEEQQLEGSQAFVADPPRPLAELALMVNLDMIGRSPFLDFAEYRLAKRLARIADGPGVGVLHPPGDETFLPLARAACAEDGLPLYAAADFPLLEARIRREAEDRGDHKPFKDRGVPYLFFSTSMHDDYHRPTDVPEKIDAKTLRRVAQAVYRTVRAADRKAP